MKHYLKLICLLCLVGSFSNASAQQKDQTYVLRPNDAIILIVYEEPDLSQEVRILKTGQASFQLIGSVEVAGITTSAAAEKIRALYAKDYLVDPKVTLTVKEYSTDYVSVVGAVKSQGQLAIPVSGNLDLSAAIASAGGVTESADINSIQLVRASGARTSYSLAAIQGASGRVSLQSGDQIIVNESRFLNQLITILGRVGRPGPVPFPSNGQLDLVTAIGMAGGLTELANPKKVSVSRKGKVTIVDFNKLSQQGDAPYQLQPGDTINVPERFF